MRRVSFEVGEDLVVSAIAAATGMAREELLVLLGTLDDTQLSAAIDATAESLRAEIASHLCSPQVLEHAGEEVLRRSFPGLVAQDRREVVPDPPDLADRLRSDVSRPTRGRRRGISLGEAHQEP